MKLKFKVGDRIKVTADRIDGDVEVKNYTGTIIHINKSTSSLPYLVEFDKSHPDFHSGHLIGKCRRCYWLNEDEIALETKKSECIVVYRKENEVIALDKSTGKRVIAKCSPRDAFDFEIGAKLAFARLFDDNEDIKAGDAVKISSIGKVYNRYNCWSGLSGYESHFVQEILPEHGTLYKVLRIAPHDSMPRSLVLIQNPNTTQVFIIGVEELKKC